MAHLIEGFDESRFERQVDAALERVRTILDTSRHPTYPADVAHKYDDKYMLVDFLTNTALATQLTCLELLGLDLKALQQMKKWSTTRTVTLRLKAEYISPFTFFCSIFILFVTKTKFLPISNFFLK